MPRHKSLIKWMDFSGAPPLLIPERYLEFWNGFYLPIDDDHKSYDLELSDGRKYIISDDFDFENPKTDYDMICAPGNGGHFLHKIGPSEGLIIADHSDGTVGWWTEQQMIVTVSRHLPDSETISKLIWSHEVRWQIPESRLLLMNSCLHGLDPDKLEDFYSEVEIEPGEYSITSAQSTKDFCVMLYRFQRM